MNLHNRLDLIDCIKKSHSRSSAKRLVRFGHEAPKENPLGLGDTVEISHCDTFSVQQKVPQIQVCKAGAAGSPLKAIKVIITTLPVTFTEFLRIIWPRQLVFCPNAVNQPISHKPFQHCATFWFFWFKIKLLFIYEALCWTSGDSHSLTLGR